MRLFTLVSIFAIILNVKLTDFFRLLNMFFETLITVFAKIILKKELTNLLLSLFVLVLIDFFYYYLRYLF
jgi:flagellar biosynthesis protein FlhB